MSRYTDTQDAISRERLIERIRSGDEAAFDRFFRLVYVLLVQFARRYLNDKDHAEDVVVSLLSHVWDIRASWNPHGSVVTYLCSAVRNRALDRRATIQTDSARYVDLDDSIPAPDTESLGNDAKITPILDTDIADFSEPVRRALASLSPRAREVFLLVKREGMSVRQAAEVLGVASSTIQTQLVRSIRALRSQLSDSSER